LDQVFQYLELSERDYFGLLFPQKPGDVVVNHGSPHYCRAFLISLLVYFQRWVDAQKQFKKQCSSVSLDNDAVPLLEFRVKVS